LVQRKLVYDYNKQRETSENPDEVTMPNVQFSGEPFIVTGNKAHISSFVGYLRMFFFAIMFMGDTILGMFGGSQNAPDFLKDIHEYLSNNKMQAGMMLFFVGSLIQAQLM
jgi:hypothetical protein